MDSIKHIRRLFLVAGLLGIAVIVLIGHIAALREADTTQVIAIVADPASPVRVVSTGCQAVTPGDEGSCYILLRNYSDAAVVIKAVNIKANSRNAQIVQHPLGLPTQIEPGRADEIYWYYEAAEAGSITFEVELVFSSETP